MAKNESIGKLISILHRKSRVYFQRELEPLGIGSGEVKIFSYLALEPGATQHEITNYFKLDKGTVSYLIRKMDEHGYVRKETDPKDRRSSKLYLTAKAQKKEREIRKIFSGWTELLLNGFTKEEKKQAFEILERMIENVGFLNEDYEAKKA
ncbi:MAG: MarR family transcriptional regulator [Balneolaceae bacterium]